MAHRSNATRCTHPIDQWHWGPFLSGEAVEPAQASCWSPVPPVSHVPLPSRKLAAWRSWPPKSRAGLFHCQDPTDPSPLAVQPHRHPSARDDVSRDPLHLKGIRPIAKPENGHIVIVWESRRAGGKGVRAGANAPANDRFERWTEPAACSPHSRGEESGKES